MWYYHSIFVIFIESCLVRSQFLECHDDVLYQPEEGILSDIQFTWLGLLQYIHVKNGNPHYFRVPRVVLISRQFVISTAVDAAQVPDGYALGNVIFGEYERDEEECGITSENTDNRACEAAVMIVPLLDVLVHPEYVHFGASNSIALLKLIKPIKSAYMLPVCLPLKDYLTRGRRLKHALWHVDYAADAPREFYGEEKEVTRLFLLPQELCFYSAAIGSFSQNVSLVSNRRVCTTDCSFHSGAPTIIHEHTGHWTIVSIAEGSAPCPDPYKPRQRESLPRHIALLPYVSWITTAITGKTLGTYAERDPFGYTLPRLGVQDYDSRQKGPGWIGHWWLGGIHCFDRGDAAKETYRIYHESFDISVRERTDFTYFLQIDSQAESIIVCIKVGSPYPMGQPKIWHLNTDTVYLRIPVHGLTIKDRFFVEAWAVASEERKKRMEEGKDGEKAEGKDYTPITGETFTASDS